MITSTMLSPAQIKSRIEDLAPGTQCQVNDLTGAGDHFEALVVSPAFAGKTPVERHKMVYGLFQPDIASGVVHALSLKTYTPEQFEKLYNKNSY